MQLKCVCLNLWPIADLFPQIVEFLQEQNADVLLLQEVFHGSDPALPAKLRAVSELQKLGYPHASFAPAFIEQFEFGQLDQGNAILSRFPIVKEETIFFDVPYGIRLNEPAGFPVTPRNLQHVTIQLPESNQTNKTLDVFNTQGIWGEDGEDSDRRREMGRVIVEQIQKYPTVLLGGDFNLFPHTQVVQSIEKHLRNIFKDELVTTFNLKQKTSGNFATSVVDMMFVSPHVQVVEHHCPQVDVSDHLPLVATIEL